MKHMIATDYETLDLRDLPLPNMGEAVSKVHDLKQTYINAKAIILSPSQREVLVKSDPNMYRAALELSQRFEKPISDLDFVMIIEGCKVEVE